MKLKFYADNIDITLTNAEGEHIYTYQANALDFELDVVKLVESIDEIKQAVFAAMEKALTESTPPKA